MKIIPSAKSCLHSWYWGSTELDWKDGQNSGGNRTTIVQPVYVSQKGCKLYLTDKIAPIISQYFSHYSNTGK